MFLKKLRACQCGPKLNSRVLILKYLESVYENKQRNKISVVSVESFLMPSSFCNSVSK